MSLHVLVGHRLAVLVLEMKRPADAGDRLADRRRHVFAENQDGAEEQHEAAEEGGEQQRDAGGFVVHRLSPLTRSMRQSRPGWFRKRPSPRNAPRAGPCPKAQAQPPRRPATAAATLQVNGVRRSRASAKFRLARTYAGTGRATTGCRACRKRPGRRLYWQGLIERRKLVAAQLNELRRQAAVMTDPGADLRRIEPHHQRAALAGRHQLARRVIVIGGGMEPEHRALGDADMVARHDPGQQGARRQAWTVDDDMLAGRARRLELANVGRDLAARIADDAHLRQRNGRRRDGRRHKAHDCRRQRAGQSCLPFHGSPSPRQSNATLPSHCGKTSRTG